MHTSRPIDHLCTVRLAPPIKKCKYIFMCLQGLYHLRVLHEIKIDFTYFNSSITPV